MDFQQAVDASQATELRLIAERLNSITRILEEMRIDHEHRLRALENSQARLEAKVNTFTMLQAAYATLVATLASILGGVR